MLATKGIFLLFEILLYLDSCSVLFFDRLLEYIHGVVVFLGIRRSVLICFLVASRDCHLKPLALSQGNWEGVCSQLVNWLLYLHASLYSAISSRII